MSVIKKNPTNTFATRVISIMEKLKNEAEVPALQWR